MLLQFTDAITESTVAINPSKVIAVFVAVSSPEIETKVAGKTIITIPAGTVVVEESYDTVIGMINGELK